MDERSIGKHTVVVDGPVLMLTLHGDIAPEEMTEIFGATDVHNASTPKAVSLVDISDLGDISQETRKVIGQRRDENNRPTAICGGSFAQRTLANLMTRLISLVSSEALDVKFFDTLDEGRAYLEERMAEQT